VKHGNEKGSNQREIVKSKDVILQNLGVTANESSRLQKIAIYKARADRKCGEWLAENIKVGNPQLSQHRIIGLKELNVSLNESSRLQKIAIYKARADRKCGEWLAENIKQGQRSDLYNVCTCLKDLDVSRNESSRLQRFIFRIGTMTPACPRKSILSRYSAFTPNLSYPFQSFGMPIQQIQQNRYDN